MSKQDRQGVRTASDLEQKYSFGKRFAEVMGIALDAQKSVSEVESSLTDKILEQSTSITRTTEQIILNALASYTQTADLEEFKATMQTELQVMATGLLAKVTATEESIKSVDGDLQNKFNTITKYFTFDIDGLTIGEVDNPNKVVIDNDMITIYVNNKAVHQFNADGTASTGSLTVTQSLNVLGLQITEDSTNINIDYVG